MSQIPDIVFIVTDTQGREMISSYVDRPGVKTPFIDRLASQGVLFENAFTTCPLCTPARSSWFTGLHPNRSGAWTNDIPIGQHIPMLADLLRDQGYSSHYVGKWHLDAAGYDGAGKADGGFEPDTWYDLTNFYDEVGRQGINRFGGWNKGLHDETFCFAHRVADRAIDVLRASQNNEPPLFLTVSFDEPHGPYICPPPFRGQFLQQDIYKPPTFGHSLAGKPRLQQDYARFLADQRPTPETYPGYYHRYYDCNSYVDYEIGRVLEAVEQHCSPNTVVIFTSDHGDHLGAFGLCAKGPTMYDYTTAVPLIIKAPQLTPGNRREPGVVSSVDIWATILDLAGLNPDDRDRFPERKGYSGRSLVPVLTQQTNTVRDTVIMEYNRFGEKFHQVGGLYPIRCIRTQDWKLSINLFDTDELYDMTNDPEEAINRIEDPRLTAIRVDLHDRLLAWQEQTRDLFRGPIWAKRAWRSDIEHIFTGLFTTGYVESWEFGALTD